MRANRLSAFAGSSGSPRREVRSRNRMLAMPATRKTPEPRLTTDT
jgi:hypothetical protein